MSAIDLIVLGMIKEKEQSAYDLQKNVEYRNISKWVKVSTPSIYKKVIQLEEKGYITGNLSREGNMPEKSIYRITEDGEKYFLELMKKISTQMVNVFLDFNAVVINMGMLSSSEEREIIDNIETEIEKYKNAVSKLEMEREEIPVCAKSILRQQVLLSEALNDWINDYKRTIEECEINATNDQRWEVYFWLVEDKRRWEVKFSYYGNRGVQIRKRKVYLYCFRKQANRRILCYARTITF